MPKQNRNKIRRMLRELEETSAKADGGRWRRDHSVITSTMGGALQAKTICFAELGQPKDMGIFGSWLKHEPAVDHQTAFANSRHIVAAQPHRMLELINALRIEYPEMFDETAD